MQPACQLDHDDDGWPKMAVFSVSLSADRGQTDPVVRLRTTPGRTARFRTTSDQSGRATRSRSRVES